MHLAYKASLFFKNGPTWLCCASDWYSRLQPMSINVKRNRRLFLFYKIAVLSSLKV